MTGRILTFSRIIDICISIDVRILNERPLQHLSRNPGFRCQPSSIECASVNSEQATQAFALQIRASAVSPPCIDNAALDRKEDARRRCAFLPIAFLAAVSLAGCSSLKEHLDDCTVREALLACQHDCPVSNIADAREAAFWASQHERAGSEQSVDFFFQAAVLSQREVAYTEDTLESDEGSSEARTVYHESLAGLIRTAQEFGRYDPVQGIRVEHGEKTLTVPISYHGFTWQPRDFNRLVVADRFVRTRLERQYFREGIGVPLIAVRETETPERFHRPHSHFAATANLKLDSQIAEDCEPAWTLELANPLNVDCTDFDGRSVRLAADFSAPTRYVMRRDKRTYVQDFLRSDISTVEPKLILLERYQPGKIPIVFIHGLLSDTMTWAELYESIKADPELRDRYQFWAFQYPTGEVLLRSAGILRRELDAVVACMDPDGADPALSEMVLVGHSMGGLMAKLQITSSEDRLWRSFANRPLDSLQTTPQMRSRLQDMFFFEPSPNVRRVVYIGTPHRGSGMADRLVGRIGSYLVRIPEKDKREYQEFLSANPGVVKEFASKRIPTSIDMLEPDDPILNAMLCLPTSCLAVTHSVIGTGGCKLWWEPSDGVVPVSSAQILGVESELFVDAKHDDLQRDPETIREVLRILRKHLQCMDADR